MTIWIDAELCNGCKRCVKACPYEGVEVRDGKAHILERCTSCGACIESCKQKAISSDAASREIPDFSDRKGVWVYAEQREGKLHSVSLELLGKAGELAENLNQEVSAVLLGDGVAHLGGNAHSIWCRSRDPGGGSVSWRNTGPSPIPMPWRC